MDNYVQRGDIIDAIVSVDVTAGEPIILGTTPGGMVAVPEVDGVIGDLVACRIKEVVNLPLKPAGVSAFGPGDAVHFNQTDGCTVGTESAVSGDVNFCGKVAAQGVAADATLPVLLTPDSATSVA